MLDQLLSSEIIFTFDNFLSEVSPFLEHAKTASTRSAQASYPGKIAELTPELLKRLGEALERTVPEIAPRFRHARLRVTEETVDQSGESLVHFDAHSLIMVCYLEFQSEILHQGTSFHQHPITGSRKADLNLSAAQTMKQEILLSRHHFEHWKIWHRLSPEVNRAGLFDGHLFHSGPEEIQGRRVTLEINFRR